MNRLLAYVSAFVISSMPVMAWAQEAPAEKALEHSVDKAVEPPVEGAVHEVVKTGAHEGGGLPQFNTHTWPSQIFWLAITFGVLYFFFSKVILPSMTSTFTARADKITGDIKAAEEISAKAQQIKEGYEAELKKASSKASSDMKAIEEESKNKLAAFMNDFRNKTQSEVASVETRIEKSKTVAMEDMQKIAAELAAQAAEKIAGIPADSAQAENVVRSLKNKAA